MLSGTHIVPGIMYRHSSHLLTPRFLANALLGCTLPIYTRAVARQAAWQPHSLPRPSCACQAVLEVLSEAYPNVPLDLDSHTCRKDSLRPFIMQYFFRFNNGPFCVCDFIFEELPCTSVVSYAGLWQNTHFIFVRDHTDTRPHVISYEFHVPGMYYTRAAAVLL